MENTSASVRLDKWLWAARFYKTRSAASEAIAGGKVEHNEARAKAAKPVAEGDRISVRKGPETFGLIVRKVTAHRGKGADAAQMYEETAASREARERLHAELRFEGQTGHRAKGQGRPTKRERRDIERLRRRRGS